MILYHFNFGFPLMSENTEIIIPPKRVVPRDRGISIEGRVVERKKGTLVKKNIMKMTKDPNH